LVSVSHALVLAWLGSPDRGLMAANYLGYWLVGVALIAVGMAASILTGNATIAFILAIVFCSVSVGLEAAAATFSQTLERDVAPLGVQFYFAGFAAGVVSPGGLVYFASLTAACLYLNVIAAGRRRWPSRTRGVAMATHYAARVAAL